MNVVLVGGARDGEHIVLPDGQMHFECVIYDKVVRPPDTTQQQVYQTERYNLFRLHPVTRAVIFALESLTPTEIMERLLAGYRPKAQLEVEK